MWRWEILQTSKHSQPSPYFWYDPARPPAYNMPLLCWVSLANSEARPCILASKLNTTFRYQGHVYMIFTTSQGGVPSLCTFFAFSGELPRCLTVQLWACPTDLQKRLSSNVTWAPSTAQAMPVALSEGITFSLPSSPSLLSCSFSCSSSQVHPPQRPSSSTSSPSHFYTLSDPNLLEMPWTKNRARETPQESWTINHW